METLFNFLGVRSPNFNEEDFIKLYQKYSGDEENDFDKKEKYRYNYLFIGIDPRSTIMLNMKERLKWK